MSKFRVSVFSRVNILMHTYRDVKDFAYSMRTEKTKFCIGAMALANVYNDEDYD